MTDYVAQTGHDVLFAATENGLVAQCSCGWSHIWLPWADQPAVSYGEILAVGLRHARSRKPLPERPS